MQIGAGLEMPNTATMVNPHKELVMADYGDAPVDPLSTEHSIGPIRQLVREVAETGTIPFVVGGAHSLMYPDVAAVTDDYGKGRVGVVHFDAHWGRRQHRRIPCAPGGCRWGWIGCLR